MANLKVKFECSGCGSSIKSEQASLFIIITSVKYKFVLHLLKEDGLNRSVLMYLFASFIPLRYCFEETTRFDVKALFAREEKAIKFHGTFHGLKITN